MRGLENQTPWKVWSDHLLYGQPPLGLDARISINIDLQATAADLIGETVGAVVLLDAESGEILVMYSSPTFDSNTLEDDWDQLIENPESPLINRAVNGLYPPGPILTPFYLAQTQTTGALPAELTTLNVQTENSTYTCIQDVELPATWEQSAAAGCPAPLAEFGRLLGEDGLHNLFENLLFYDAPEIRIDVGQPFIPNGLPTPTVTAYGQADILVSPLQLAIAASAITNHGKLQKPNFLLEAEAADGSWINYRIDRSSQVFLSSAADQTAQNLSSSRLPIWEVQSYAQTGTGQRISWYMGGSLPTSTGGKHTIVILLEEPNPPLAAQIGRSLLTISMTQ